MVIVYIVKGGVSYCRERFAHVVTEIKASNVSTRQTKQVLNQAIGKVERKNV